MIAHFLAITYFTDIQICLIGLQSKGFVTKKGENFNPIWFSVVKIFFLSVFITYFCREIKIFVHSQPQLWQKNRLYPKEHEIFLRKKS